MTHTPMIGIGGKDTHTNTGFMKLLFHPPSNLRKNFAGEEACTDEIMSAKKNERNILLVNQSKGFSLQCVAGAVHCTLDIVWRFAEFKQSSWKYLNLSREKSREIL